MNTPAQTEPIRLIALCADAPAGFSTAAPNKRELLSSQVALFTRGADRLPELVQSVLPRLQGVLIVAGEAFSCCSLSPGLLRLGLPQAMCAEAAEFAAMMLGATAEIHGLHQRIDELEYAQHARELDAALTRHDYIQVSVRLRARIEELTRTRAALADSEQQLRRVLDELPSLVFTALPDGRIVYCNHAFAASFPELARQAEPSAEVQRLIAPPTDEAACAAQELTLQVHGQPRVFQLTRIALELGDAQGMLCVASDVTQLKAEEQQMRQLNEMLEERVAQRTAALAKANDELRAASDRLIKAETLASLGRLTMTFAHELNTPLGNARLAASSVRGAAAELAEPAAPPLQKRQFTAFLATCIEAGDSINRNLDRAEALITQLRGLGQNSEDLHRTHFSPQALCASVLRTLQPQIARLGHSIELLGNPEGEMESYPEVLVQVLEQLIDNALAHGLETHSAGRIELRLEREGDSALRLAVADNGCGMSAEVLSHALDPLFTTRLGRNIGLGLYAVHARVSRVLGGEMSLASEPNAGTCVTLRLPLIAPQA